MKMKFVLIINLIMILILNGCYTMAEALTNNLNGIEKTLKDIYKFNHDEEDIGYFVTPHDSDVVSVIVALDRSYSFFKLLLDINLTNNRNLIIRDYNGKLKDMKIQKFGDYAIEAFYYNSRYEEGERYWQSFHGVDLYTFNWLTGLKHKKIKDIIDNYDIIYEKIENLPEIIKEENKYIIYFNNEIYVVNVNEGDDYDVRINNIFSINNSMYVLTNNDNKILLYKRKWTEEDTRGNFRRISGER